VSLYSDHIFRRKKDENGYLMVWGRWVEVLVTLMIIINAVAWWAGVTYASWILGPRPGGADERAWARPWTS
jgi:hypothetical protein